MAIGLYFLFLEVGAKSGRPGAGALLRGAMASNQDSEASTTEASFNEWKALIESSLSRVSELIGSVTREVEHLKIAVNSYSPSILTTNPSSTSLKKPLKVRFVVITRVFFSPL